MKIEGYLAERERIEQGATAAPWLADRNCVFVQPHATRWWIANTNTIRGAVGYLASPIAEAETEAGITPLGREDQDAAFIADARTAVPTLIAMVREARETLTTIAEDDDGESWSAGCAQRALARLDAMATEDAT